jgi:alkylation response protein AidB-like acyl-CoA dehydrogenase
MNVTDDQLRERAVDLADNHLFPAALDVDAAGIVPIAQLDLIADAGFYGLFSPTELGGLSADKATLEAIHEAITGGCLTTAFIWTQHGGPARASAMASGEVHDRWARDLASGTARGGVAFAHLLRAGAPVMTAEPTKSGWSLSGTAPFVSGWGHIDVLLVAARHGENIVWAMIDPVESATLASRRLHLAAVDSTVTVELTMRSHVVHENQVTHIEDFDDWLVGYQRGLRTNGSIALGVASRCLRLLGPSALDDELAAARHALDNAPQDEMTAARSWVATIGVRAASALVASSGGSAMLRDHHAQRLAREALFLLVQGVTPEMKALHIKNLTHST